jgi:hypothetical protein
MAATIREVVVDHRAGPLSSPTKDSTYGYLDA